MSLESRQTFNIRCESADEFGEGHQDFTEAADWPRIPFLLTRRLSGTAENPCRENSLPTRNSAKCAPASDASVPFPHLSVNRGIHPLTSVPGRRVPSAFRRCAGYLTASLVLSGRQRQRAISSLRHLGSGFIPMTEEPWLVHVTEPVTETIS